MHLLVDQPIVRSPRARNQRVPAGPALTHFERPCSFFIWNFCCTSWFRTPCPYGSRTAACAAACCRTHRPPRSARRYSPCARGLKAMVKNAEERSRELDPWPRTAAGSSLRWTPPDARVCHPDGRALRLRNRRWPGIPEVRSPGAQLPDCENHEKRGARHRRQRQQKEHVDRLDQPCWNSALA
jgi:hypothetical protein